jgi:hypothetical protein
MLASDTVLVCWCMQSECSSDTTLHAMKLAGNSETGQLGVVVTISARTVLLVPLDR